MAETTYVCPKCGCVVVVGLRLQSLDGFQDTAEHMIYKCLACEFEWTPKSLDVITSLQARNAELLEAVKQLTRAGDRLHRVLPAPNVGSQIDRDWRTLASKYQNEPSIL